MDDGTDNRNVFVGYLSGFNNDEGSRNTFIGFRAGHFTKTGGFNIFVGAGAGYLNLSGFDNSFFGAGAGYHNTAGSENSFFGDQAGWFNELGGKNTFIGDHSGFENTVGSYNTGVGFYANSVNTEYGNSTGLGYNANPIGSNTIHLGNSYISSIKGQVGITTYSDKRIKTNIQSDIPDLEFILELRPVSYQLDLQKMATWQEDQWGRLPDTAIWNGKNAISNITFSGFLAQDVDSISQSIGYDFSGVDRPSDSREWYGLRYGTFVVPLVKGMQEQQIIIEAQNDERSTVSGLIASPNPFPDVFSITYNVGFRSPKAATIILSNSKGNRIKEIFLDQVR